MAIATDNANICHGAATTLGLGGVDLGPTTENGVSVKVGQTFFDHKNDQIKGIHKKTMIDRDVVIDFELEEATLENLHMALNLDASALSDSSLTINDTQADDAALTIVGVGPQSQARSWIFDAVQLMGAVDVMTAKNDRAVIAMSCQALFDTTNSRFGIVGDASA